MSYFEKDKLGGGRPAVSITINGIGNGDTPTIINGNEDVEDVPYE